ncbi:MAG: AzlC family ABC transporter permease [Burkholderiales bacterium]|nr:AzlC family ABC transporter permease [Burkholderiales bacterium]
MTRWRDLPRDPHFRRGARDMLDFGPGLAAWGLVTGVAMTQSGLGVGLSLLMTFTVYAGSAQLASLPLIAGGAPIWVIWASALCVNLRFAIFSSQWRPYLGHLPRGRRLVLGYLLADLNLLVFLKNWQGEGHRVGQARYAAGGAVVVWIIWQATSVAGILLSSLVPLEWGLGFAGTLSMLGIAYSLLNDRTAWVAAIVAAAAAVAAFSLPLKLNILVAIAAAIAATLVMAQAGKASEALRPRH